jgi:hypothetical protein
MSSVNMLRIGVAVGLAWCLLHIAGEGRCAAASPATPEVSNRDKHHPSSDLRLADPGFSVLCERSRIRSGGHGIRTHNPVRGT